MSVPTEVGHAHPLDEAIEIVAVSLIDQNGNRMGTPSVAVAVVGP